MPAAAWAARSGDPILFADGDDVPEATLEVVKRHPRAPIYVLGPGSAISSKALKELGEEGGARQSGRQRGPGRERDRLRPLRRRRLRLGHQRPRPRLRHRQRRSPARRGGRGSTLGRRQAGPAAADRRRDRRSRGAPGIPPRHPARLHRGPVARALQPRLAARRSDRALGRLPGAGRRPDEAGQGQRRDDASGLRIRRRRERAAAATAAPRTTARTTRPDRLPRPMTARAR